MIKRGIWVGLAIIVAVILVFVLSSPSIQFSPKNTQAKIGTGGQYTESGSVNLQENFDTSIRIDINEYYNFDPLNATLFADMSDRIFAGETEVGRGEVVLPLVIDDETIIDFAEDYDFPDDDVPGLHVLRGENENGRFVQFNTHGENHPDTREVVIFAVYLRNGIFTEVENLDFGDYEGYEWAGNNTCDIYPGTPWSIGDDEYTVEIGYIKGGFCSITGSSVDRVRVYYEPRQTIGSESERITSINFYDFDGEQRVIEF